MPCIYVRGGSLVIQGRDYNLVFLVYLQPLNQQISKIGGVARIKFLIPWEVGHRVAKKRRGSLISQISQLEGGVHVFRFKDLL